jgi:hypothetical protein
MAEDNNSELTVLHELAAERAVKDTWFHAYMRGNSLFPQTNREGIGMLVTGAIVNDPPIAWKGFFRSEVSDEQVGKMGKAMDGFHNQAEVRYSTKPVITKDTTLKQRIMSHMHGEGKYQIKPERLQGLWKGSTEIVGQMVLGYIDKKYYPMMELSGLDHGRVESFFTDPRLAEKASKFKQIMTIGANAVSDEEGRKISNTYKAGVAARSPQQSEILIPIRKHVTDAIREQFPEENLDWLYGQQD